MKLKPVLSIYVIVVLLYTILFYVIPTQSIAADNSESCPAVVGENADGKYPHIYEKIEFETINSCLLTFSENPDIASLNKRIKGNPELPGINKRLPSEPLIIAPYSNIGEYGGVFEGISKSTEAGTSDLLSIRHTNLVRYSDDLSTIVPNVAKSWSWDKKYTVLTFKLREGHKWSDGAPFTSEDIVFWYHNLVMDKNITKTPKIRFLSQGKAMKIEAVNKTTIRFILNEPKPGLTAQIAMDFAQYFQPKHILGKFHPKLNNNADKIAKSLGFESGYDVIRFYYGQTGWKDYPSPLLKDQKKMNVLVKAGYPAVLPTLETHILIEDTPKNRRLVANPYFFQVDTQGNQLPYINEIDELYVEDEKIQTEKLLIGAVDYKAQSINIPTATKLMENFKTGGYFIYLRPTIDMHVVSPNLTIADKAKRQAFNDIRVRKAMSHAIDRNKINKTVFFNLGRPMQYTGFDADTTAFVTDKQKFSNIKYNKPLAEKLLNKAGIRDTNGNGIRNLPDGKEFKLNILYSTQGFPSELIKQIAQDWTAVGIQTSIKEVTTEEYRKEQLANKLDILAWIYGNSLAVMSSNIQNLVPPYGTQFGMLNGIEWERYEKSKGKEGIKPPVSVSKIKELALKFITLHAGTNESNTLGRKITQMVVDNLFFIGTVKGSSPIYTSKRLGNFEVPKTASYEFYRVYPYIPSQWYLMR